MRVTHSAQTVTIPKECKVELEGLSVTVTGPRGTLFRSFAHIPIELIRKDPEHIEVGVWLGTRKNLAYIRTVCAHIENLIKGVIYGFQYKMRAAYSHFPINLTIVNNKSCVEIRNYLGEKFVRKVEMLAGVTIELTDQKDELVLRGCDIENVSQSAATIQQCTAVKDKDVRKFLDGIYVSEKGTVIKVAD